MLNPNLQEIALEINAQVFASMLPIQTDLNGLRCDIFLPLSFEAGYDDDSKQKYSNIPNEQRQILIFNYFALTQYSRESFDPYITNKPKEAITLPDDKLILNSKIVVYQGDSYYSYRVNNFKTFNGAKQDDGTSEIILVKNMLIPEA